MNEFSVSIEGRPTVTIETLSSFYWTAVMACSAHLTDDDIERGYAHILIWVDRLLPNYGPYKYTLFRDERDIWQFSQFHLTPGENR